MARLPVPGSDDGSWGDILNTYLSVAHDSGGNITANAVKQAGGVTSVNGKTPLGGAVSLSANEIYPANVISLTDGANIALDASAGFTFRVTLGGNHMLSNPANAADGQRILVVVTQDATGSRVLSYDTDFVFGTSLPQPTLSTAAGATDYLGFVYDGPSGRWRLLAFQGGF